MLEFDRKLNLIKQAKYKYDLQNVEEPNLYREIYDYEHIPKIAFNMRHVPGGHAGRDMDHGHDVPGRPAVSEPLYAGADRALCSS